MNPESPLTPREEIEVRLTAMLMGELPPEEAAALEAQMADDAELAALHARLRQATDLLREACAISDPPAPPVPVNFSPERREQLLEHFKGSRGASVTRPITAPPKRDWPWMVSLGLAAAMIALIGGGLLVGRFWQPRSVAYAGKRAAFEGLEDSRSSWRRWDVADGGSDRVAGEKLTTALEFDVETASKSSSEETFARSGRFAAPEPSPQPREPAGETLTLFSTVSAGAEAPSPPALPAAPPTPASGPAIAAATPGAQPTDSSGRGLGGMATGGLRFGDDGISNEATDGFLARQTATRAPITPPAAGAPQAAGIALGGAGLADATLPANAPLGAAVMPSLIQNEFGVTKPTDPASPSGNFSWSDSTARADTRLTDAAVGIRDYGFAEKSDHWFGASTNRLFGSTTDLNTNRPETEKQSILNGNISLADQSKLGDHAAKSTPGNNGLTTYAVSGVDYIASGVDNEARGSQIEQLTREKLAPEVTTAKTDAISAAASEGMVNAKTDAFYTRYSEDKATLQYWLDSGLGPSHPTVTELQSRLDGEKTILDANVRATTAALDDQVKMAQTTVSELGRIKEQKKEKITDEKNNIAEYDKAKEDSLQVDLLQKMVEEQEKTKLATALPKKPATIQERAEVPGEAAASESKPREEDVPVRQPQADAPVPQPEIETQANPFSTFSLNVSDVAFKLAQASLEKSEWPAAATVRSEEFINAFDYRDPEPAARAPLAFASERARYPFAHNRDLLRLSVKTAAAGRQPGRALNVVLLLDNSGSMERADRVQIVREALRVLAAQLQPQDKLSIITFARTPRLVADGIAGNKAAEETARVGDTTPQGGTNIAAALALGYQTALRHYNVANINRVVMLTDGAANLGDVDPEALKQKVEAHRRQGIALDCFGVGWEGYNDNLLEILSRNGDGRYGFINTIEAAATEFAGQLAGALRVAASDVKVQVEFNPRRVTAYRQIGYAKHQLTKEQFRDNTVDAAEIGAAESGNALYVIEVNPLGEGDIAAVRVRFRVPGTETYREHEWPVPFNANAPSLDDASPALRLAGTAAAFSEWLVSSPFAAEVTSDRLLGYLDRVPAVYGADPRPQKLEWMIRQAKSVSGK